MPATRAPNPAGPQPAEGLFFMPHGALFDKLRVDGELDAKPKESLPWTA